ncbi:carbonic anhydrase 2-like [Zophobas morio]|uniref:carbonic anhydrase 2-like n=1 Tax=Zophobas morio TaxID=2755281 RepID=UPI0030829CCD
MSSFHIVLVTFLDILLLNELTLAQYPIVTPLTEFPIDFNYGNQLGFLFNDLSLKININGGGLNDTYTFLQMQFRWRAEHIVNCTRYALEIVAIFYNSKYGNYSGAIPKKDESPKEDGFLSVVSFYQLSSKDNPAFKEIVKKIPAIKNKINKPVALDKKIRVADFLPKNTTTFYRYHGSITKPYCEEIVTFLVFPQPSYISETQVTIATESKKHVCRKFDLLHPGY